MRIPDRQHGHLTTTLFEPEAKVTVNHIPYRGSAPDYAGPRRRATSISTSPRRRRWCRRSPPASSRALAITPGALAQFERWPHRASARPKLDISTACAFATAARRGRFSDKLNAVLRGVMDDPRIGPGWADTASAPYPKNERSQQPPQALLHSEIVRWGEVVRAKTTTAPTPVVEQTAPSTIA